MDLILIFPGQGSQKPGMAKDLAETFPVARRALDDADRAYANGGASLTSVMFDGPADALTHTDVAQPALLAHGAAVWAVIRDALGGRVRAAAGHSLGEFTAYHAAGALSLSDATALVAARGALMREAGEARPGTMAAILGTMTRSIDEICAEASSGDQVVVAANFNTDEQIVISGSPAAVARAAELAKAAGAKRSMPIPVSGAFHSPLMESAAHALRGALDKPAWTDPAFPVYSNVDAAPNTSTAAARELLVRQLTSSVRWTETVRRLAADHPGAMFVECGPGNVATNTIRRIVPDVSTFACGTAAQVHELLAKVAA